MGVRKFKIAGIQTGPIAKSATRAQTVERLVGLLKKAADSGAVLAVFPEMSLTPFFPKWYIESQEEVDSYFEKGDISTGVCKPLFEAAAKYSIGFYLGYCELTNDGHHYNSAILVDNLGQVVHKYRKVHLPGFLEPSEGVQFQQLEKRYFEYGDQGFQAYRANPDWIDATIGMLICNDRRWPESWRTYALQGMDLMLIGYNSIANGKGLFGDAEDAKLRQYHSDLAVKSNAYFNSCFAVSVGKCGNEEGQDLIGGSLIVDPNGLAKVQSKVLDDDVIVTEIDLDETLNGKTKMFDFARHRRPEFYRRLVDQKGSIETRYSN
ncbi:hypothetical protein OGAPHI_003157 [Ogataea philodendri]|uniref:CN hydrolase domain-containing protein n=1 Tax=Ogataea philodendri TaxID=1378263 RepID=A0A9P8P843_9ASCO|nr:uncharacterized protein OGAPHI_003157 [Ogataea philodendri]KAH3667508.1 hypothetical protein OGAPHI_003157 [Ogataea philodendri]